MLISSIQNQSVPADGYIYGNGDNIWKPLKQSSALNDPQDDRNKRDNKQYVNETTGTKTNKSNCPSDDQEHCNDIK